MARTGRRFGAIGGALVLVLVAGACTRAPAPAPAAVAPVAQSCASGPVDGVTARVVELANSARAAAGLAPLAWDGQLYCLARSWSQHMAATGQFTHSALGTTIRTPPYNSYRTLGENILRAGGSITGDQMHNAWMSSASHRANILSGSYRWIAIATAVAPDGTIYATTNFGG